MPGFAPLETLRGAFPETPIADQMAGTDMLYSSGTTGRPKGIRPALEPDMPIDDTNVLIQILQAFSGAGPDSVYLSPAPLYHAAPLRYCMTFMKLGATLVIMEKFDAESLLKYIQQYKVTHMQMVPTMFVKLLKLPEEVRKKYDVSSLQWVVHAAAPCPVPVKEQMIEWWGPIIDEYYAGSEGNGMTWARSDEWMAHKGTVGKAVHGEVKICNEEGDEVPVGEEGQVYFAGTTPPNYHNSPDKNEAALNPKHKDWSSLGDVGKLDKDGFLYLTDRKAFMIISGGVNIYPQECENIMITHPKVADVAVIGVPDEEFGESVKAVVQPMPGIAPSEELAAELMEFAQANLSKIKCPKSVDFDPELPRHPTGKLYKRLIRDPQPLQPLFQERNSLIRRPDGVRYHGIVQDRRVIGLFARRADGILHHHDIEALFDQFPHMGIRTKIGSKAAHDHRVDAMLAQLHHKVVRLRPIDLVR